MKQALSFLMAGLLCLSFLSVAVWAEPEEETIDPSLTQLDIVMTVERPDDQTIKVSMLDERGGIVSSWPVSLIVDGRLIEEDVFSSESGEVLFQYTIPEDAKTVACRADSGEIPGTEYYLVGNTVYLEGYAPTAAQTTTSEADVDVTTRPTLQDFSMLYSDTTTTVSGDQIGCGLDIDNGVLNMFQISNIAFNDCARLWVDKSFYDTMVADASATIHLNLSLNTEMATKEELIAAKNADPAVSSYADDQVKGFAMNYTLSYIENGERTEITAADGMYRIELPEPASMKNCEKIAVAVCTSNGLAQFVMVKRSGGTISFTIQRFQTLALVGFYGNSAAVATLSETPWMLTVILIGGIFLMAAAVLIVIFVVLRRQKASRKKSSDGSRYILLAPSSEGTVSRHTDKPLADQPVVMDLDAQETLTEEEREHFRARSPEDDEQFDQLADGAVSPAEQITVDSASDEDDDDDPPDGGGSITVDDLLDELMSDKDYRE
ncbi:MAG: hypothetical protein IJU16_07360 [Clostridia bacterium]|nr:hypothetical protein [Clostridia bacterium]